MVSFYQKKLGGNSLLFSKLLSTTQYNPYFKDTRCYGFISIRIASSMTQVYNWSPPNNAGIRDSHG